MSEPQIISKLDENMCECRHHKNAHRSIAESPDESCNECRAYASPKPCMKFTLGNIYSDFKQENPEV